LYSKIGFVFAVFVFELATASHLLRYVSFACLFFQFRFSFVFVSAPFFAFSTAVHRPPHNGCRHTTHSRSLSLSLSSSLSSLSFLSLPFLLAHCTALRCIERLTAVAADAANAAAAADAANNATVDNATVDNDGDDDDKSNDGSRDDNDDGNEFNALPSSASFSAVSTRLSVAAVSLTLLENSDARRGIGMAVVQL
jgi:hypothetical protein